MKTETENEGIVETRVDILTKHIKKQLLEPGRNIAMYVVTCSICNLLLKAN